MRIIEYGSNEKNILGRPRTKKDGELALDISRNIVLTFREIRNIFITGGIIGALIPVTQGLLHLIK